jgi:carbon monoxide dehydrogenase subunit G
MENRHSIDIERPREAIFDFLTDPKNIREIVPNLVDEGIIEEKPGRVGTTFWHVYEERGRTMKMTGVVTEHQPPERSAVSVDGAMFGLDVTYVLEEIGPSTTRLTQVAKVRWKHVFKIMGLLFQKKFEVEGRKSQVENFERLKSILETQASV